MSAHGTPTAPHRIESLTLACAFASEALALAQQDRLGAFLRGPGQQVIHDVFERWSTPEEVWQIEALELDLGLLGAQESDAVWASQLATCLDESLARLQGAQPEARREGRHARRDHELAALAHYLAQGYLPWSLRKASRQDLAAWLEGLTAQAAPEVLRMLMALPAGGRREQVLARVLPLGALRLLARACFGSRVAPLEWLEGQGCFQALAPQEAARFQRLWRQQALQTAGAEPAALALGPTLDEVLAQLWDGARLTRFRNAAARLLGEHAAGASAGAQSGAEPGALPEWLLAWLDAQAGHPGLDAHPGSNAHPGLGAHPGSNAHPGPGAPPLRAARAHLLHLGRRGRWRDRAARLWAAALEWAVRHPGEVLVPEVLETHWRVSTREGRPGPAQVPLRLGRREVIQRDRPPRLRRRFHPSLAGGADPGKLPEALLAGLEALAGPPEPGRRAARHALAALRRRSRRPAWRWGVAGRWDIPRLVTLVALLGPAATQARVRAVHACREGLLGWLPGALDAAVRHLETTEGGDAPWRQWLWAATLDWAVLHPGAPLGAEALQAHWRACQARLRPGTEGEPPRAAGLPGADGVASGTEAPPRGCQASTPEARRPQDGPVPRAPGPGLPGSGLPGSGLPGSGPPGSGLPALRRRTRTLAWPPEARRRSRGPRRVLDPEAGALPSAVRVWLETGPPSPDPRRAQEVLAQRARRWTWRGRVAKAWAPSRLVAALALLGVAPVGEGALPADVDTSFRACRDGLLAWLPGAVEAAVHDLEAPDGPAGSPEASPGKFGSGPRAFRDGPAWRRWLWAAALEWAARHLGTPLGAEALQAHWRTGQARLAPGPEGELPGAAGPAGVAAGTGAQDRGPEGGPLDGSVLWAPGSDPPGSGHPGSGHPALRRGTRTLAWPRQTHLRSRGPGRVLDPKAGALPSAVRVWLEAPDPPADPIARDPRQAQALLAQRTRRWTWRWRAATAWAPSRLVAGVALLGVAPDAEGPLPADPGAAFRAVRDGLRGWLPGAVEAAARGLQEHPGQAAAQGLAEPFGQAWRREAMPMGTRPAPAAIGDGLAWRPWLWAAALGWAGAHPGSVLASADLWAHWQASWTRLTTRRGSGEWTVRQAWVPPALFPASSVRSQPVPGRLPESAAVPGADPAARQGRGSLDGAWVLAPATHRLVSRRVVRQQDGPPRVRALRQGLRAWTSVGALDEGFPEALRVWLEPPGPPPGRLTLEPAQAQAEVLRRARLRAWRFRTAGAWDASRLVGLVALLGPAGGGERELLEGRTALSAWLPDAIEAAVRAFSQGEAAVFGRSWFWAETLAWAVRHPGARLEAQALRRHWRACLTGLGADGAGRSAQVLIRVWGRTRLWLGEGRPAARLPRLWRDWSQASEGRPHRLLPGPFQVLARGWRPVAPLPASRRLRPPELQGVGGELLGWWRRAGSPRPGERPPSLPEAPSERLGELARILDRLRQGRGEPALRLRLADLLASPGVGDAWLEATPEPGRWDLLAAFAPRAWEGLRRSSEALLRAARELLPDLAPAEGHQAHWAFLVRHVFVGGDDLAAPVLARRYACHLAALALEPEVPLQAWHRLLAASLAHPGCAALREGLEADPSALEAREAAWLMASAPVGEARPTPAGPPWVFPDLASGTEADPIWVADGGMVILAPYLPRLFAMLQLTEAGQWVSEAAQEQAIHALAFLVAGHLEAADPELALGKVLCGAPLGRPLGPCGPLPASTREALDGLLTAVIAHWKSLGRTSLAGLRETFLQREGRLVRKADEGGGYWHLTVEPRPFDMLVDKLPWSFATLKLPWMEGRLLVDWR